MSKDATMLVTKNYYRSMLMTEITQRRECAKNYPNFVGTRQIIDDEERQIGVLCSKVTKLDDLVSVTQYIAVPVDYVMQYGD